MLTLALLLTAAPLYAQDAAVQGDSAPGLVDPWRRCRRGTPRWHAPGHPATGLPPGHPPTKGDAAPQGTPEIHRAEFPRAQVEERDDVPPGELVVQVVDAQGNPVPEAMVRLGQMRGGEPGPRGQSGARAPTASCFERLATGQEVAYRVSTERDGARFGPALSSALPAPRRPRPARALRREPRPRAARCSGTRFELHFRDERLTVVQRMRIVNPTAMSIGGGTAGPAPRAAGYPCSLSPPRGFTAFSDAAHDGRRLESEGDYAVLRGALAPTTEAPLEVVFQYQPGCTGETSPSRPGCRCPW
ncbi:MAG: hypothetical protein R3A48_17345 [Polyangiales bacterium]